MQASKAEDDGNERQRIVEQVLAELNKHQQPQIINPVVVPTNVATVVVRIHFTTFLQYPLCLKCFFCQFPLYRKTIDFFFYYCRLYLYPAVGSYFQVLCTLLIVYIGQYRLKYLQASKAEADGSERLKIIEEELAELKKRQHQQPHSLSPVVMPTNAATVDRITLTFFYVLSEKTFWLFRGKWHDRIKCFWELQYEAHVFKKNYFFIFRIPL